MKQKYLFLLFFVSVFFTSQLLLARPIGSFRELREMSFGIIIPDSAGDVVTLSPSGGLSSQNMTIFSGSPQSGFFTVKGDKNTAFVISFSSGDVLTGPGGNMPLGSFTHDAGASPAFPPNGTITFNVGASLTIGASQQGGGYTGSYTVFADYL
tara:strand:+ start:162 stop:620 length:459 start_codon:yes stop_codon:yes gene_type:complete